MRDGVDALLGYQVLLGVVGALGSGPCSCVTLSPCCPALPTIASFASEELCSFSAMSSRQAFASLSTRVGRRAYRARSSASTAQTVVGAGGGGGAVTVTVVIAEAVWPLSSTTLQVTVIGARCRTRRRQRRRRGVAADRSSRRAVAVGQRTVLRAHAVAGDRRRIAGVHRRRVRRAADGRRLKRLHRERRRAIRHLARLLALGHVTLHVVGARSQRLGVDVARARGAANRHARVSRPGVGRRLLRVQVRRPCPSP